MATYGSTLRRGLPRRPGDDPWPPAGDAPLADATTATAADATGATTGMIIARPAMAAPGIEPEGQASPATAPETSAQPAPVAGGATIRRGLPRVAGGEPWPPAVSAPARAAAAAPVDTSTELGAAEPPADRAPVASAATTPSAGAPAPVTAAGAGGVALRRGLPRTEGGEAWPPEGMFSAAPAEPALTSGAVADASPAAPEPIAPSAAPTASAVVAATPTAPREVAVTSGPRPPLTAPRTVWPGRAATHRPAPPREPKRLGPFTRGQWLGIVVVGGGGLLFAAAMAVLLVRVLLSMPFGQDFLAAYPGEYHLPEGAPVGFPAWLGWQHFFNVFLMVLIIRSGLTIRTEKRPTVFWTPKGNKKGKTSLTIWFHQALDVLWLVNGAVFVVLLFVTGQWMRIVPTSWEVFPNALSAALQYVSLDWPTENGWVNYNALQQLAYFTTVFVAAPLAAITGYRMSGLWPKKNQRLSTAYPIEWARRVHFPVMLYFVAFIIVHVALVFATGALRNLNHMYAAQGSVDGTAYADNWTGFWIFVASMVVIAAAWVAARPLTLAPLARLFGTVSGR